LALAVRPILGLERASPIIFDKVFSFSQALVGLTTLPGFSSPHHLLSTLTHPSFSTTFKEVKILYKIVIKMMSVGRIRVDSHLKL